MKIETLAKKIKIFVDTADLELIKHYLDLPWISGCTMNQTLLRDYFSKEIPKESNFDKTGWYFHQLSTWNKYFNKKISIPNEYFGIWMNRFEDKDKSYVKVPVLTEKGNFNKAGIKYFLDKGFNVNVTAIFTEKQMYQLFNLFDSYGEEGSHIWSVFMGRINDTMNDISLFWGRKNVEFLWASTRELYNIQMARDKGFDIITISPDLLSKVDRLDKTPLQYCRETIAQFNEDGKTIR